MEGVDGVLFADGLGGRPKRLGHDEAAVDAAPRVLGALSDVGVGAMGLEFEDAGDVEGLLPSRARTLAPCPGMVPR